MRASTQWKVTKKGSHRHRDLDATIANTGSSKPYGMPGTVSISLASRTLVNGVDTGERSWFHIHMDAEEALRLVAGLTSALFALHDMTKNQEDSANATT